MGGGGGGWTMHICGFVFLLFRGVRCSVQQCRLPATAAAHLCKNGSFFEVRQLISIELSFRH